jgi:GrpB-like predicted nucleotidyltransferase (UPF0157 family)
MNPLIKLTPRTVAEKDFVAHVLFALSDHGVTGDWEAMVDHAVRRCRRGQRVHQAFSDWLREHPQKIEHAYTETQHEEGAL